MKKYYGPDFLTVSVLDTVKSFILPRHISLIHPPYNLTSRRLTSRRLTSRRLTSRRLTSRRMTSRRMTLVSQLASWSDCSFHKKNGPASLSRSRVVSFEWRERERFVKLVRGTRGGRRCQKQSENRSECHKTKIVRFKVSYRDGLEQRGASDH